MSNYKLCVNNQNYNSCDFFDTINLQKCKLNINHIEYKLFSNDVFTIDENNKTPQLLYSDIRSGSIIPGVLILTGNKTYGRKQINKKEGKLLYKCIPNDKCLPSFLIPYEIKNIGFVKVINNLYITFTFDEWREKHPMGKIENIIGDISELNNFYNYHLVCNKLNISIRKFTSYVSKIINNNETINIMKNIKNKYPSIEDRTNKQIWHIITIDPPNTKDFDDGFSIINHDNDIQQLSIYISNVVIVMDFLNLWDLFTKNVSTIYLPNQKQSMIPNILSERLCSLTENCNRIAFVMDIYIKKNKIIDIKYSNCLINVYKNYCYEEDKLIENKKYQLIFDIVSNLSISYPYINVIKNSHDIVRNLMCIMNYNCAKIFIKHKTGIFLSIINKELPRYNIIPEEICKFITIWNYKTSQYINGITKINIDDYTPITSPIRRIVDLLNMLKFQSLTGMVEISKNADNFYDKWVEELEYINITMKKIKKVQRNCALLELCYQNPELMEKEYEGYLFNKISTKNDLYKFIVFIPELKLYSSIKTKDKFNNYDCKKIKLFLFKDDNSFKRKIRIHI